MDKASCEYYLCCLDKCLDIFVSCKAYFCLSFFDRGSATGVLLRTLWEIQCHGPGAAGAKSRRPL